MRIKNGYELKKQENGYVIVSENGIIDDIVFSDTAVFLWNLLKKGNVTKGKMLEELLENFKISTVLALGDIDTFIRVMRENEVIE